MAIGDQSNITSAPAARQGPVVLIASPHAGQASSAPAAHDLLDGSGITVGLRLDVGDLDPRDPQGPFWSTQGYTCVVAAGGDGTIGCVANQVAGTALPLGILPLGTSNDVARALGIPLDPRAAAGVIRTGVISEVDAGQISTLADSGGRTQWVHFVHAATLGLNAEFARLATDVARRQHWGGLTYASAAVEALLHMQAVPIKIDFFGIPGGKPSGSPGEPDFSIQADVVQVAAVNTPIFGGRMNLQLPLSHAQDKLLDFVIIEALGPSKMVEMIESLVSLVEHDYSRGHRQLPQGSEESEPAESETAGRRTFPGVWHIQAQSASIETRIPVDLTLDGELGLRTPAEIRVARDPLGVLVPRPVHEDSGPAQVEVPPDSWSPDVR
jgi:diacylglycerol kinase (ATP)